MRTTKTLVVATVGAIALFSLIAVHAGNVVRIVKDADKSVPKYEETKYSAALKDFNLEAEIVGDGLAEPSGGNIGEFLIENIKLTMKEKKFKDGGIETEELGKVRVLFSSNLNTTGFIALLTDEQLKKLETLVARFSPPESENTDPFAFNPTEKETGRIFVPKQYPTIQKAVDAAEDGNVIVLSAGVYEETVTITKKSITLRSENPKDQKLVASTIVDANQKGNGLSLEDSSSTIWGITVRGGHTASRGGGIFIHGKSSALIKGNIVEGNSTDKLGGGICIVQAQAPRILGNTVRDNKAAGAGGIEAIESTVYLKDNRISGNTVSGPGGGAFIRECKGIFRENVVASNSARAGGGLYISKRSRLDIVKNEFVQNSSEAGAGIMVLDGCTLRIEANSFVENRAKKLGGGFGFGMESKCRLLKNRFERNEALKGAVGFVEDATIEEETNNTFKDNTPNNEIAK